MGDLIDTIFQRPCSLADSKDCDRSGSKQDTGVTVLEVGAQETVDTYHCRGFDDLRDYTGREHEHHRDSLWDEPSRVKTSSLRLLLTEISFLPPQDGHASATPLATGLPGFSEMLHENIGVKPMFIDDYCESDEECVSPTALPHPSALETRSRRARFILDGLNEDAAMTLQPQKEGPKQSWTWETRYTKSRTQTVADPDTTTYLCMNFPQRLQKRISDTIHSLEALARNPLFMDTLIIDEMISFYRDAIKTHRAQLLAVQNDEETSSTDMSIKLEELAGNWRTILRDIQSIQTHIQHLQSVAETRTHQRQAPAPAPARYHHHHHHHHHNPSQHRFQRGHTRQESSEVVLGPPAREILQLQNSTCEFWSRCVGMYLERTTARIDRTSTTYRLHKTIPLGQGQQGQQGGGGGALPQQLNRRLSNLTVEVAVKIQRSTSSSSVSTLALSLLSTIFFSPDGLVFAITYWWWILVTLVVPLTFVILHLWFETLASNTAFVRRRKAQRLGGGVAEDGVKETDS